VLVQHMIAGISTEPWHLALERVKATMGSMSWCQMS